MTFAVYPGTFDPLTKGHFDLIRRAAALFDKLIIAVAPGQHKNTYFNLSERLAVIQSVVAHLPSVKVMALEGLLVDFAAAQGAHAIIRGLRTAADFEYEFQLAGMNQRLNPTLETLFMTPSQETLFISSTLVREIIRLGGDVSQFVPAPVYQLIQERSHGA
jgi:pantetheine-phosphate adenylyltransferase